MGARRFNGTNQSLLATSPVANVGFSVACWVRRSGAGTGTLLSVCRTSGYTSQFLSVGAFGVLNVVSSDEANGVTATSSGVHPTNRWFHAGGTWTSSTSRAVYLENVKATNGDTKAVTSLTRVSIGKGSPSYGTFISADIALPAIYSAPLTDQEVELLSSGYHPRLVRPWDLASCWNLGTNGVDCEPDTIGGFDLAITGAVAVDGPPGIIYPPSPDFVPWLLAQAGSPAAYYRLLVQNLGLGG